MKASGSFLLAAVLVVAACGSTEEKAASDAGTLREDAGGESGDAGSGVPDGGCEKESWTVDCPFSSQPPTVLEALRALEASARTDYPAATWRGVVAANILTRDGRLASNGLLLARFCDNEPGAPRELFFVINAQGCSAERRCVEDICEVPAEFPSIDSDQAIGIAYPGESEENRYGISYLFSEGNFWSVNPAVEGGLDRVVKVDATSGEIVD
ncbi:MAG TPA: hypothetical protein DFS52_24355 [Myxococcales bacterium]|jgi:hypothetical protein|nr:hypothetical protein [Myxococcales bacterium]